MKKAKNHNNRQGQNRSTSGSTPKSKNNGMIEQDGTVIENCGNTNFKVQLDINPDMVVKGTISGKMRMHYIKIGVGDRVKVEITPYDLERCRITRRL